MNLKYILFIVFIKYSYAKKRCSAGQELVKVHKKNYRRRRTTNTITVYQCKLCSPGKYQPNDDSQDKCIECPSGTYQSSTGSTKCDGTLCSVGKYGVTGSTKINSCFSCQKGKYQDKMGKGECILCSAGMWNTDINATSCQGTHCEDGSIGPIGSTTPSLAICKKCSPGKFEEVSKNICLDCPLGKYQSTEGNAYCISPFKLSFGERWIPTNNRTYPPQKGSCLFSTWRKLSFYSSVFLSIVIIHYMFLIHKYNIRSECIYTIEIIFIIYIISVSLLIYNCFYEKDLSYIAIAIINIMLNIIYIVNIILTYLFKKKSYEETDII